ncbi:transglutaminase family protein [Geitlerinema splendidum]|nr:transglutaminase family protein [Geitlerinema splendidum]
MYLDIEHEIRFSYDDYISESWVELRMEPLSNSRQTVNSYYLAVGPRTKVFRYLDWAGNAVRHFSIAEFHKEIQVKTRSVVETQPPKIFAALVNESISPTAMLGPYLDYLEFDGPITKSRALLDFVSGIKLQKKVTLGEQVEQIGKFVHDKIKYVPNVTSYDSDIEHALKQGAGVCQDMAQIMIGALRLAGIPARYVNGYLHVANKKSETSESHAWVEFYSREYGWVGYDPTGGLHPGEHHVVVATGRHYDEVPPNRGVYRGAAKEKLTAVVMTKEVQAPVQGTFHEEIKDIELPVYSEIPLRRQIALIDDQMDQTSQ